MIIIKQKISNLSIPDCGLYFQIKVRQEKTCNIWKRDVFKKKTSRSIVAQLRSNNGATASDEDSECFNACAKLDE